MARRTVISLFSGAGGLDFGFEAAGYDTRLATDRDHDACASLKASRPRWRVEERDITTFNTGDMLAAARLRPTELDVLIGGPPCQPFSKSGFWKRYGQQRLADPRAQMLGEYMRVVEQALPRVFLLENVRGLNFSSLDDGFQLLLSEIEKINAKRGARYKATAGILNAADYGVPQFRERLFIVACREGSVFKFPNPTHGPTGGQQPWRTAWDALADETEPEEDLAVGGKWAGLLPSIPEGENYLFHTNRGGGEAVFGWRCRYWNFLLKLAKNRPSWTIQASPGPSCGPFHWKNRRLSSRELARLQTFPQDLVLTGSERSQRRQLGNAVPSLLGEVLAREIATQLLGGRGYRTPPVLMPPDRGPPPRAERRAPFPEEYKKYIGTHPDHPGEGRGRGALARGAA